MAPIADIHREIYFPYSAEHGAACVSVRYISRGSRRQETFSYECASDWSEGHRIRTSEDNGRTWSDWTLLHEEWPVKDGFSKEEMPIAWCHDPASGKDARFVFHRLLIGKGDEAIAASWRTGELTYFDHNFWQLSDDGGGTWGKKQQLRYEDGGQFDPENWGDETYLRTNRMYGSYAAIATRQGTIVYPAAEVPMKITDRGEMETVGGILCFIGKWSPVEDAYLWEASDRICVPHRISGRGLMEPAVAELSDGRIMLSMRGSNVVFPPNWKGTVESPGRKWMTLSEDGGHTWSRVTDLRYASGEQFYSPSAFDKLLRHSRTGKLYWFGNITPAPPDGNRPRYPLYVAEVEESIPALKRDTLTVIDNYDPEKDTDQVQFSNFSVLEDRETGDMELYMTRYGERPNWLEANACKYTITLLQ